VLAKLVSVSTLLGMAVFEVVSSNAHDQHIAYAVRADNFPFSIERHRSWLTTSYWNLPKEYSYTDFLRIVEQMFMEAESNGYESNSEHPYFMSSSELERVVQGEFIRPLEPGDFEEFGITDEEIGFLRLGDDLAQFYYDNKRLVGALFEERPHQTRSAFSFMANLFPSRLRLESAEIGQFVLGLKRP